MVQSVRMAEALGAWIGDGGIWTALAFLVSVGVAGLLERVQFRLRANEGRAWWASNGRDVLNAVALGAVSAGLWVYGFRGPLVVCVAGTLVLLMSLAPLVPWTLRNWRQFHRFEPLAPRYASDPDEFVPSGFDRWMRSWIVDYASTEEVYWQVPGSDVDLSLLPARAFDSDEELQATQAIFDEYAKSHFVGPELNQRFEQLAEQRIRRHPLRYYVWLPLLRIGDMWLRPRTEMLPLNSRWWEFVDDPEDCVKAALWGGLNLLFLLAAAMGLIRGPRPLYLGMMLLFVGLRSAFLGTIENPEPRYTLESYPVVLLLAGAWISGWTHWDRGDL